MIGVILFYLTSVSFDASAQQVIIPVAEASNGQVTSVYLENISLKTIPTEELSLQMSFTMVGPLVSRQRIVTLTPRLVGKRDSIDFPAIELYGKWAYYAFTRSGINDNSTNMRLQTKEALTQHSYGKAVSYQSWMDNAELKLIVREHNACGDEFSSHTHFLYARERAKKAVQPKSAKGAAVSTMTLQDTIEVRNAGKEHRYEGTAFIDYRVSRTNIDPNYHHNARELARIRHTIDSITNKDYSLLQHISLKGYASPEGSYDNNARLAQGRVMGFRDYLIQLFNLDASRVSVAYEPEDWVGFRNYVENMDVPQRPSILAIIDSDVHPDTKLARIANNYPKLYQHFSSQVFPYLRHTDYSLSYVTRDSDEVKSVIVQREVITNVEPEAPVEVDTVQAYTFEPEMPMSSFEMTESSLPSYKARVAIKTNLLFDLALAPNIEVEVPLGRKNRWSLMGEVWFPWWRLGYNAAGKDNQYYRSDQRPTKHAYQLLTVGAEARYWWSSRCGTSRPVLSGAFVGLYVAGGKYDLGYDGEGNQGEFTSFGISGGYSWPLSRHWNLELSAAVGYVGGPKVHYVNEFDDTHLIYRYNNNFRYIGPTKLKVSIVWLLGKRKK